MPGFYSHAPKDLEGNLAYRLEVRKRARGDKKFRRALWQACSEDVLYFFNTFCWLHEPRNLIVDGYQQPHVIPFITRTHQDPVILAIDAELGRRDIGVSKARGEGMTWIMVLLALRDWLFKHDVTIGMCSNTADKADIPDNRGTLLGKLDWQIKHMLPKWMAGSQGSEWERVKSDHTWRNVRRQNTIVAYSAVGGTGRGDRYLWFLLDELAEWSQMDGDKVLASLQHATECRVYVSTPQGPAGTYYDLMHRPSNMLRISLDWKDNPARNRGMYQLFGNKPVAMDPVGNPLPPEYSPPNRATLDMFSRLRQNGFKLEGKVRSPWYDNECDRSGSTPQSISQELDQDFEGSVVQYFTGNFFAVTERTVRPPRHEGRLHVDAEENFEAEFETVDAGEMKLWCELDTKGRPPQHDYVVGVDISSGLAGAFTSNSAAIIFDLTTREQVGEWAENWLEPPDFAELCIGICRFFWDAHLIWEVNYGGGFMSYLLKSNYPNLHRREVLDRRTRRVTKKFGWLTTNDSKIVAFDDFRHAVQTEGIVIRSKELSYECTQYMMVNGVPRHSGTHKGAAAGHGTAHGDRVIGAALANQVIKRRPAEGVVAAGEEDKPLVIPPNCMAARMRDALLDERHKKDPWDRRSNWDLAR